MNDFVIERDANDLKVRRELSDEEQVIHNNRIEARAAAALAAISKQVDEDMATPLVQTILSSPPNAAAFRATLTARYLSQLRGT